MNFTDWYKANIDVLIDLDPNNFNRDYCMREYFISHVDPPKYPIHKSESLMSERDEVQCVFNFYKKLNSENLSKLIHSATPNVDSNHVSIATLLK